MSTDKGYIKLFRDVRDHWIWADSKRPEFDSFHAWVDLLMMVNHKDGKTLFDGKLIKIKRGSTITSLRKLSERWHWSKSKVAAFLDMLEADGMIKHISDNRKTVLTIENYGFYQDAPDTKRTLKRRPSDAHQTPIGTNNNVEECKKNEEETPPEMEDETPSISYEEALEQVRREKASGLL